MNDDTPSLQQHYAPENGCFGCGHANDQGLRIRSRRAEDGEAGELVCDWSPAAHHQAFGNVLNGGVIGAIFDCHSNWTASICLMDRDDLDHPPCTVTLDFAVRLKRPTAVDQPLQLRARPTEITEDRVRTEAELVSGGKVTAVCTGTFVAVKPGHPAYHRW